MAIIYITIVLCENIYCGVRAQRNRAGMNEWINIRFLTQNLAQRILN